MAPSATAERRRQPRQHLQLRITLLDDGRPLLHTRSRDLSLDGIQVEADGQRPAIGALLQIGFSLRSAAGDRQHRLPARVVRHAEQGIALAFGERDGESLDALRTLLYDGSSR